MSPERRQRVREVFATVADLAPEERNRALQDTCGGDPELRSGVESLLERHDSLGGGDAPGAPLLAPGDLVSERFKVLHVVGSGGMGEVYKCEDVDLGQPVALKALRPNASGSDAAERFKREIQIARSISHANVCRVYEYGRHPTDSAPIDYFIMEYVEGETLADYLERQGPLTPDEAKPLVQQMAAGLEALHDGGVVHRDLKPGNILLDRKRDGRIRVVLTDFGIAGSIGENGAFGSFATVSGQVMGTPQYMAPEQLTGFAAGPSTDLFALGIVLYEMLTGQQPFPDKNRRTDPPAPPSAHNPAVSADWDRLVLNCLQTDLSKRPNSVDAVFDLLGLPTRSFDPSRAQTVALSKEPPQPRTWPWKTVALVLAAVALIALGLRDYFQTPAASEGRRIAVLPFVLAAGGEDVRALADGLTDTITSRLSQYESLNEELLVVPAAEVRKAGIARADNAGGALGVNYAVEGHMSAQDDRIRLTLTLIDTERKVQQESTVIDGLRSKALDLEDEAVTRLATMLDLHALPDQVDSIAVVAPGAQEFYLQGNGYLQRSDELESVNHAIQLFEKAISLDESYARAHAGLSRAYLYKRDRTNDPIWVAKAAESARRAVELQPGLLEAQTARGYALLKQGKPDEAVEFFQGALESNPRSAEAYAGLGRAYADRASDLVDETARDTERRAAEAAYLKAISLRPNDWVAYKRLGIFYASTGRYEDAIEQYKIVAELAPDNAHAYVNLGIFYHFVKDDTSSRTHLEKALELDPNRVIAMTNLAALAVQEGDHHAAMRLYQRALQVNSGSPSTWESIAGTYRMLGRDQEADAAYREAIKLLEKRVEIEGESLEAHADLAHHYAALGVFDTALGHARKATASERSQDQVSVAIAFSRAGETVAAREALRRAIARGYNIEQLRTIEALQDLLPDLVP